VTLAHEAWLPHRSPTQILRVERFSQLNPGRGRLNSDFGADRRYAITSD
jgi:hypothetical protein